MTATAPAATLSAVGAGVATTSEVISSRADSVSAAMAPMAIAAAAMADWSPFAIDDTGAPDSPSVTLATRAPPGNSG